MHKVINLKNDEIFRHSVRYNDAVDYASAIIKFHNKKINEDERKIPDRRLFSGARRDS